MSHVIDAIALRGCKAKWIRPHVLTGCVNIIGGLGGSTPISANSIQYMVDGEVHTFIELTKYSKWCLKCVGGDDQQRFQHSQSHIESR